MTASALPGPESEDEGCIRFVRFDALPGVEVMDVRHVSRQWAYFHETYSFCAATWVADARDVRLRVALRHAERVCAQRLAREVTALYTCGPAGGGGVRTALRPTLGTLSCLLPREQVPASFEMLE